MTSNTSPAVAIITVTYKAAGFIEEFLKSVTAVLSEKPAFHLVVVDNASPDATVATVQRFIDDHGLADRITLLAQADNAGFGRGCNAGAKEAAKLNPQFLWFLNPDTTVDDRAADELLNCFATIPAADFVGSALRNEAGVKRSGAYRFPGFTTTFLSNARLGAFDRMLSGHTSTFELPEQPIKVDWLTGASFMVKTSVFESLEGFDPNYFLYFEEVDLFLRASRAGYTAWFCPTSVVYHQSGASTGINTKSGEIKPRPAYWFESRRYFYIKNYGRAYFLATDSAFLAGQGICRFKSLLKREKAEDPPQLARSIMRYSGVFGGKDKPQANGGSSA